MKAKLTRREFVKAILGAFVAITPVTTFFGRLHYRVDAVILIPVDHFDSEISRREVGSGGYRYFLRVSDGDSWWMIEQPWHYPALDVLKDGSTYA